MVLVRDRRAEERHDAVAGVLVDRALEAVHAVGEDLEEALEDRVPLLGVDLLGELHRALHVGEEHRHLLALALERRRATAGSSRPGASACRRAARARAGSTRAAAGGAPPARAPHSPQNFAAGGSSLPQPAQRRSERRPALEAELRTRGVRVAAARAGQRTQPRRFAPARSRSRAVTRISTSAPGTASSTTPIAVHAG